MGKGKKRIDGCWSFMLRGASIAAIISLFFIYSFPRPLFPGVSGAGLANSESAIVSTSTPEGRLAVFDDAWSTINTRYYDRRFHGLDWEAQRATFRTLALQANSGQELYSTLRQMIALLNDPHTRVFSPEEKFDWRRPRFVSIGLAIRDVGGLPTVVHVERESGPDRAGIRVGDVIETINGEPAVSLVNRRLTNTSASTSASSRFRAFAMLMEGPPDTVVDVVWKRKDGNHGSGQFRRYWQQRELGLRIRSERGGLAIIEIDAFTKPIVADLIRALKGKIAGAQGVILDLRKNGGGDAEAMTGVASAFLRPGLGLGQFTGRDGSGFTIATHSKSPFIPAPIVQTQVPLFVLTSERTASAAEILIAALKNSKRATVIGTETCGCVLAIRTRHLLPDGGLLDVSELDYRTPAGERLEKHGIAPDETVVVQRNDLYSGRDRAMELAKMKLTKLRSDPR